MTGFSKGLRAYLSSPDTGFRDFIGRFSTGNLIVYGPFIGDGVPQNTEIPYMTCKYLDATPTWAFKDTMVTEEIPVRFTMYDHDYDDLETNVDTFVAAMDAIRSLGIPLSDSETDTCRSIIRTSGPIPLANKFDKQNERVYSYSVTYLFRVQRDFSVSVLPDLATTINGVLAAAVDSLVPGDTYQCIYLGDHQSDFNGPSWDNPPPYTRNSNRILSTVDFTGVFGKVLGQAGNSYCGSVCVGDHTIIGANHCFPTTFNAVDATGAMTLLTVNNSLRIGTTDIQVINTNEVIPSSIKRHKLLPPNYGNKISFTNNRATAVYLRRDQRLYLGAWENQGTATVSTTVDTITQLTDLSGWNWGSTLQGGDSGNVFGLVINGEYIPIGCWTSSGTGPNLAENFLAIQEAMTTLNGDILETINLDGYKDIAV